MRARPRSSVAISKGCSPVLLFIDEAGRTAIPSLAQHATTVVGRGLTPWLAFQSLSQLTAVYGKEGGQVIRDNMESQVFYRPTDPGAATYLQHRLGYASTFAHSETMRDGEVASEGRSEQAVPLLCAQETMQLPDADVLAFHRGMAPFRARRQDWRHNQELVQRHSIPAPDVVPCCLRRARDLSSLSRSVTSFGWAKQIQHRAADRRPHHTPLFSLLARHTAADPYTILPQDS
jgi:type IV secretory pathway TraG/TraD family ATPase VirD4